MYARTRVRHLRACVCVCAWKLFVQRCAKDGPRSPHPRPVKGHRLRGRRRGGEIESRFFQKRLARPREVGPESSGVRVSFLSSLSLRYRRVAAFTWLAAWPARNRKRKKRGMSGLPAGRVPGLRSTIAFSFGLGLLAGLAGEWFSLILSSPFPPLCLSLSLSLSLERGPHLQSKKVRISVKRTRFARYLDVLRFSKQNPSRPFGVEKK